MELTAMADVMAANEMASAFLRPIEIDWDISPPFFDSMMIEIEWLRGEEN
jgi:hypothetical protein